ncbi:MAG: hypothetical protein U0324_45415 [Polyangiales bacterium]
MSGSTMKKRKDEARADDAGAANDATEKAGVANDAGERRTSFAAQYQRFLAVARALEARDVVRAAGDPVLVLDNLRTGVRNLLPHEAALRRDPTVPWDEVFELEALGEGFVFATDRVSAAPATGEEVASKRAELQALRGPALLILRGLAQLEGTPPLAEVEAIEAGNGVIDMARDGIAIACLVREHGAALAGKHPLTEARLTAMEALGEWILRNVSPDGARAAPAVASEAEALRDRFWTEIVRRHKHARAAGFKVYGEDFGRRVPALQARATSGRKAAADEEPDEKDAEPKGDDK